MGDTFANLQTRALQIFKRTDKTAELKEALNAAYREMVAAVGPRKLQDQVYHPVHIGREEYPVPSNLLRLNHPIRLLDPDVTSNNSSSHHPLKFITKDEYDVIEPFPNAPNPQTSRPWVYTLYKNSILLSGLPDKEYVLEMNIGGEPTELASDPDITIFREMWDETHIAGALSRLYAGIGLIGEAGNWADIYNNGYIDPKNGITGGLNLLKKIEKDNQQAPLISRFNAL